MDLEATVVFQAPIERTWDLLMDTGAIAGCLPGCRDLHPIDTDRYDVELDLAISAIAGSFKGTVALEEKDPPRAYTLVVAGSGRQGFVNGRARMTLAPDGDRTAVHIAAHADVGGALARLGQRLIEGVARTLMDRFFACLSKRVRPGE
jgi:carbon monoxide dehydrogenase subunit G